MFVCVSVRGRKRYCTWLCGTERGQSERVRKLATSCWVFPEVGGKAAKGHGAPALWGVRASAKETKGRWRERVTRPGVQRKRCYTKRWREMRERDGRSGKEHVWKTSLNIKALVEVLKRCRLKDAVLYLQYIFLLAFLIPCQRMHHPSSDEQNSW